jgi:signal transduction histidine kinase
MTAIRHARMSRFGLAGRLFAAQSLVVLVGAVSLGLVAAAVGPVIFRDHLQMSAVDADAASHVEEAYASASAVSLGVALVVSLAAALGVSAFVARRVAHPVRELAVAAAEVARGQYQTQVAAGGMGREFETVAQAFNAMAGRLADVEATRRRLLSDLGHELRTPVATIEAYVDAAEDGVDVTGEDTWSVIRKQTMRLRRLTDDVAAVSRAEEHRLDLQCVRMSAADLISAAVASVRPRFEDRGVHLRADVDASSAEVDADPERIGQVLGNLLDNALRHTPRGGTVTIGLVSVSDGVRLSITDTGDGIAAGHLPHVFERFYRVDPARDREHGGSGIGLAIVQAIVAAHGGRVEAASEGRGMGATFVVSLPAARS